VHEREITRSYLSFDIGLLLCEVYCRDGEWLLHVQHVVGLQIALEAWKRPLLEEVRFSLS
jgi:hypothetical protein